MGHLPGIYGGGTDFDGRSILILPRDLGRGGHVFRLPDAGTAGLATEPYPEDGFPCRFRDVLRFGRLFRRRHALEHRVIHVLHAGWPATPDSLREASPYTMRCGSVVGSCLIAGLLALVAGLALGHTWLGLASLGIAVPASQAIERWQIGRPPLTEAAPASRAASRVPPEKLTVAWQHSV